MAARIEEPLPSDEEQHLIDRFRRFQQARAYASEHHDALLRDYPEHWVAVSGDGVVAAKPRRHELMRALGEMSVHHNDVCTRFITAKPQTLVL